MEKEIDEVLCDPAWDYAEVLKILGELRQDLAKLSFYVVKQESASKASDALIIETLENASQTIEVIKSCVVRKPAILTQTKEKNQCV